MQKYTHVGVVVPTIAEQKPLLVLLRQIAGRDAEVRQTGIWRMRHTQLDELRISIIHSGMGMVNAGAATEALVIYEQPQVLINYGIAGAHTHDALPGDIIIATQVCAPFNGYLRAGSILDSAFGIRWEDEGPEGSLQGLKQCFSHLSCDPSLVRLALQAAQVLVEQHTPTIIVGPSSQEVRPVRIMSGVMASADTYCQDEPTFARIRDRFDSLGEDMESAAVGQVAARHGLPFAIIRCLSNNDLLEVLTGERKKAIFSEMMRRSALVTASFLQMLSTVTERT